MKKNQTKSMCEKIKICYLNQSTKELNPKCMGQIVFIRVWSNKGKTQPKLFGSDWIGLSHFDYLNW